MGAKTALLAYADGDVASALREADEPTAEGTAALIAQVFPGWGMERTEDEVLGESTYPPEGLTYAASFQGVDLVCDRRLMFDRPSELPPHLLEAAAGRRVILHAMHSVSDWLAFAVWEEGRLRRSLSLSPDGGIVENIGDPFPFEMSYWAGDRPVESDPEWDEELYALPFHPLELGNEALRALFGFLLEGRPLPEDVNRARSRCSASTSRTRIRRGEPRNGQHSKRRPGGCNAGVSTSARTGAGAKPLVGNGRARPSFQPRCLPDIGDAALFRVPPLLRHAVIEDPLDLREVHLWWRVESDDADRVSARQARPGSAKGSWKPVPQGARPVHGRPVGASLPAQPPWEHDAATSQFRGDR
ncbi:DUF6928 family protein [Streptomyces sp. MH13]|uniref:DUF6928 family protein n=1 Tax=Streptomyces sp. MH13 TaxID=3417651 RepID=UPI003CF961A7